MDGRMHLDIQFSNKITIVFKLTRSLKNSETVLFNHFVCTIPLASATVTANQVTPYLVIIGIT